MMKLEAVGVTGEGSKRRIRSCGGQAEDSENASTVLESHLVTAG